MLHRPDVALLHKKKLNEPLVQEDPIEPKLLKSKQNDTVQCQNADSLLSVEYLLVILGVFSEVQYTMSKDV